MSKKAICSLSMFFLLFAFKAMAGTTEFNEFEKYTADELLDQFDNLSWTSDGVHSFKVVYVIGAPWCPATKRMYDYHKKNKEGIQFRYIMVSPENGKEVLQNKLLSKSRDPKTLDSFFRKGSISGQDSISAQITHDANFETIEKFIEIYEKKYKHGFGFPTYVFYTETGWETDWRKFGNIKERPAETITPLSAKIADEVINEYKITSDSFVTKTQANFYAYPSTKATKLFSFSPNSSFKPLAVIELKDKTIWVKTAAHTFPGGYQSGGWTQMENLVSR